MSTTGYTTDFDGAVTIEPPLNAHEISYLNDFARSRRMDREEGPYFAQPGGDFGQTRTPGVRNYNDPPAGQPGLWCHWEAGNDFRDGVEVPGASLQWNGGEKFYYAEEWMKYVIDHFLKPGAEASKNPTESVKQDARFAHFTFDHVLNGEIEAQGEDPNDRWMLVVRDNQVFVRHSTITFGDEVPV